MEEVETTVGKDWSHRALVVCVFAGLTLVGPVEMAASSEIETQASLQRVQPSPVDYQKSHLARTVKRKIAKRGGRQSVRSTRKNQNIQNRAELNRGKAETVGKGLLSVGEGETTQDLSYHGILEQPQRYDPSRNLRNGAVPNPRARDLRFDHFRELDKNRDGVIDPLEKATSRLDIERDMSNYTWE